mmetsp:Transcript_34222/g.33457  ORF Transcript_34222/g.33457 Transcript_34222/m.33457 type:complete len:108 (-) Transcript_34222:53-376(-)
MSLAGAFLNEKKGSILLLDEPTSQIDSATQKKVLKNLFQAYKNCTVFMIAHRLETAVTYSDRVLVLDHGHIMEFQPALKLLVKNIEDTYLSNTESELGKMVEALGEA